MGKFIVRRSSYRSLPQDALSSFSENVFSRMSSLPEYAAYADEVTLFGQALEQYKDALAKATNGGRDRIAVKNEKMAALLERLDRIADLLNAGYTGNDSWVVNAGMETMRGALSNNALLEAPYDLRAEGYGNPGELLFSYKLQSPERVRQNAIEYSVDGGESWKNGSYTSNSRIQLKGLPVRQEVRLRVRSLGVGERISPWSKVLDVFVV